MIEMTTVVAAQDPKARGLMEGRIAVEECLEVFRHAPDLDVGKDPVDPTVETPDEVAFLDVFEQEGADAMDGAGPKLCFNHHHERVNPLC